jgi:hypothetical protein
MKFKEVILKAADGATILLTIENSGSLYPRLIKMDVVPEAEKKVKPPLGVTPKYLWLEERLKVVDDAILRYKEAGEPVPCEWISESNEIKEKLQPALIDMERDMYDNNLCKEENTGLRVSCEEYGVKVEGKLIRNAGFYFILKDDGTRHFIRDWKNVTRISPKKQLPKTKRGIRYMFKEWRRSCHTLNEIDEFLKDYED